MSLVDDTIRLSGRPVTIIRNTGSVSTFMTGEITGTGAGRRRLDPFLDYETAVMIPSDAGIITGDLALSDSEYYLCMAVEKKFYASDMEYYRGLLYKCNSVVSIYYFDTTSKKYDSLHKANVHCLITQVKAQAGMEDKALIIREYRGKSQPFQVFMRESEGLKSECVIVDQDSRRYRVSKDFDVFIADSIAQTQCMWEN